MFEYAHTPCPFSNLFWVDHVYAERNCTVTRMVDFSLSGKDPSSGDLGDCMLGRKYTYLLLCKIEISRCVYCF